jgi:hypothetical protein
MYWLKKKVVMLRMELPPLAISLMRSKGLRSSPLSFEAPILPKPPTLPSPEAPLRPPAPVSEGMDVVDEV